MDKNRARNTALKRNEKVSGSEIFEKCRARQKNPLLVFIEAARRCPDISSRIIAVRKGNKSR